jgi:hypothetical protein
MKVWTFRYVPFLYKADNSFQRNFGHPVSMFTSFFLMALPAQSGPRPLIQFRNHFSQTVGLLGRVIRPSQGRYLNTGQHKQRINAYTHQISMPWVGFEPKIPASERAKTVHASDRASTVTGMLTGRPLLLQFGYFEIPFFKSIRYSLCP